MVSPVPVPSVAPSSVSVSPMVVVAAAVGVVAVVVDLLVLVVTLVALVVAVVMVVLVAVVVIPVAVPSVMAGERAFHEGEEHQGDQEQPLHVQSCGWTDVSFVECSDFYAL